MLAGTKNPEEIPGNLIVTLNNLCFYPSLRWFRSVFQLQYSAENAFRTFRVPFVPHFSHTLGIQNVGTSYQLAHISYGNIFTEITQNINFVNLYIAQTFFYIFILTYNRIDFKYYKWRKLQFLERTNFFYLYNHQFGSSYILFQPKRRFFLTPWQSFEGFQIGFWLK